MNLMSSCQIPRYGVEEKSSRKPLSIHGCEPIAHCPNHCVTVRERVGKSSSSFSNLVSLFKNGSDPNITQYNLFINFFENYGTLVTESK